MKIPNQVFLTSGIQLADPDEKGRRECAMLAYTGAVFDVGFGPAVAELSGIQTGGSFPLLRQHDPNQFVGRSTGATLEADGLMVRGFLFDSEDAREVASLSDQGAEWQASVGLTFEGAGVDFVAEGKTRKVNGADLAGPFVHIKRSHLKEVSFVPLGADPNTRAVALGEQSHFLTLATGDQMDPVAEALKHERERVSAIQAEFAADYPDFVNSAIRDGLSLEDCRKQIALAASIKAKAEAERKATADKIADLEARLAAKSSYTTETVSSADAQASDSSDPVADWNAKVDAEFKHLWETGSAGLSRGGGQNPITYSRRSKVKAQAINNVAARHPELHMAFLAASNPSPFAQSYYQDWKSRGSN